MSDIKRRDFLKATAGVAAGTALGSGSALFAPRAEAQLKVTPEKGAKLRVLRWKRFVQGDEDTWAANTKKFTADDRHRRPRRRGRLGRRPAQGRRRGERRQRPRHHHQHDGGRAPVSRQARRCLATSPTTSATKYGGWYQAAKDYGMHDKKWVAIMMGAAGATLVGRESQIKAAGFDQFPRDMGGFLKLCQALKAKGTPARLRARQRHRRLELDVLAPVGARRQDGGRQEQRRHQQPGDDRRARILEAALRHVHPGDAVVARPEQQQGVPRRPDRADQQRHLRLLRGEDIAGPEAFGNGERHPALPVPAGGRRQVPRARISCSR